MPVSEVAGEVSRKSQPAQSSVGLLDETTLEAGLDAQRFFFESALRPSVFWVELDNLNLEPGASVMKLETLSPRILAGEVSAEFEPAEPFKWLGA